MKDRDTVNVEMRTFHCDLATKLQVLHRTRCPCCSKVMVVPRKSSPASNRRRDLRTVAHDRPRGFGGDPTVWVYTCQDCNNGQGTRTFRAWAMSLDRMNDERATRVHALADIVDRHYQERSEKHVDLSLPAEAAE